jgi:hypothetical protein
MDSLGCSLESRLVDAGLHAQCVLVAGWPDWTQLARGSAASSRRLN